MNTTDESLVTGALSNASGAPHRPVSMIEHSRIRPAPAPAHNPPGFRPLAQSARSGIDSDAVARMATDYNGLDLAAEVSVTYNFDPEAWFARLRTVLEVRLARGDIDAETFRDSIDDLERRYEEMVARLDGTSEIPGRDS